jgi:proton translocating ATP synthase F1 alpha subunit
MQGYQDIITDIDDNLATSFVEGYDEDEEVLSDFGVILTVSDNIVVSSGLENALYGELVLFDDNLKGLVISLERDFVKILVFGNDVFLTTGAMVRRTHSIINISLTTNKIGCVMDPLGNIITNYNLSDKICPEVITKLKQLEGSYPINVKAPGVITRHKVFEPMETGLMIIDTLIPVGRGQRELIIGDKQTGKTAVAIDSIISQKQDQKLENNTSGLFCIYVAIGQKKSSVVKMVNKLLKLDAMFYTTVISATASDSASLQYIAPYSGCTLGE